MTDRFWKRLALPLSVFLILSYWAWSVGVQLLRTGSVPTPGSVGVIAGYVCLKTAIVLAVVLGLLRANGEGLPDLGFTGPALKAAFVWGPLVAAGVFVFVNVVLSSALRALATPGRPDALGRCSRESPASCFLRPRSPLPGRDHMLYAR